MHTNFHNKISISDPFEHMLLKYTQVLEQHESVQMGLKLKFCYENRYAFVDKILI